jgi:hypothetical protein
MATFASVVETLGPQSYRSFLEPVATGQDAFTHKALVAFHDGTIVDAYVKVYCQRQAPKGLVNEVTGYVLAKGDGLPVPQRAAVLLLTAEQSSFLPSDAQPLITPDGHVVAWCVQSVGGQTPLQAFNLFGDPAGLPTLLQDFSRWANLSKVVSLDAWLLNEDRNMGNLVRVSAGMYALIDHGRICTGNSWRAPLDRTKMKHVNKVAYVAWGDPDVDNAPSKYHPLILDACARHNQTWLDTATDIEHWLTQLLHSHERDDVTGFIGDRTGTLEAHLRAAYGVLL